MTASANSSSAMARVGRLRHCSPDATAYWAAVDPRVIAVGNECHHLSPLRGGDSSSSQIDPLLLIDRRRPCHPVRWDRRDPAPKVVRRGGTRVRQLRIVGFSESLREHMRKPSQGRWARPGYIVGVHVPVLALVLHAETQPRLPARLETFLELTGSTRSRNSSKAARMAASEAPLCALSSLNTSRTASTDPARVEVVFEQAHQRLVHAARQVQRRLGALAPRRGDAKRFAEFRCGYVQVHEA